MAKRIILSAVGFVGALLVILFGRVLTLGGPQQESLPPAPAVAVVGAAERLALALQIRTVSHGDRQQNDTEEFSRFCQFLEQTYPRLHADLERELVGEHSLLYRWPGSDLNLEPVLLAAHYDVVPADEGEAWTHPPFGGVISEGFVWGRGAIDDKSSVLAIFEAIELLLERGQRPTRTIYVAIGHDEEIGGMEGARQIARRLETEGKRFAFVLDEGMAIVDGIIPGVAEPVALIGIAEKGYLTVRLQVEAEGGHSSMPPARTAVGILSEAISRVERAPMAAVLEGPARQLFETLAPSMGLGKRLVFANLWLLDGVVLSMLRRNPRTDALVRTTGAATMFTGSPKENVLPTHAEAVLNFRIRPGEESADVLRHLEDVIDDPAVRIVPDRDHLTEPSSVSSTSSTEYGLLRRAVRRTFPHALVAPSLVLGKTDSRYYAGLTDSVFRFVPQVFGPGDAARVHGVDERISVSHYLDCVRFYLTLMMEA
jgi:carboxypeptidase PM20D1